MLPIIYSSSFFTLYSYPLFMGLAWGFGFYLTKYFYLKYQLETKGLNGLFIGTFISAWIGAKVFFLYFSSEHKIYQYLYANHFWLGGGFVFYGGLIFGIIFYLFYSLGFKRISFRNTKYLIPGIAFGHAIGRLGCFLTGCCFGKQCDLPWKIYYNGNYVHPVQLYEAISLIALGILCLRWISKGKSNFQIITNYLLLYSSARFIIEYFRGDDIRGIFWSSLSTSQLISVILIISSILLKFFFKKKY